MLLYDIYNIYSINPRVEPQRSGVPEFVLCLGLMALNRLEVAALPTPGRRGTNSAHIRNLIRLLDRQIGRFHLQNQMAARRMAPRDPRLRARRPIRIQGHPTVRHAARRAAPYMRVRPPMRGTGRGGVYTHSQR